MMDSPSPLQPVAPEIRPLETSSAQLPPAFNDETLSKTEGGNDLTLTLQQAILHAKKEGPSGAILLVSSAVVLGVVTLSILLLVYIFVINNAHRDRMAVAAITSTANLQYVITISGLLSTVVSRTVPAVVTVYAYHVAAVWLKSSQIPGSRNRPSPLQYVLVSLCQGRCV